MDIGLDWVATPRVVEVGQSATFKVNVTAVETPEDGLALIGSALVASLDPLARPSPDNSNLSCFRSPDLWERRTHTVDCEFDEPGIWHVRGYWEQTWGRELRQTNSLRSWSEAEEVMVIPAFTIHDGEKVPGPYDPAEPVILEFIVESESSISGSLEVVYDPKEAGGSGRGRFLSGCPETAFEGPGTVHVQCDWSEGGKKMWTVFAHVTAGDHVYTKRQGAGGFVSTIHEAWEKGERF